MQLQWFMPKWKEKMSKMRKKDSLNAGELAKNDADMNEIKIQMAEMAKI